MIFTNNNQDDHTFSSTKVLTSTVNQTIIGNLFTTVSFLPYNNTTNFDNTYMYSSFFNSIISSSNNIENYQTSEDQNSSKNGSNTDSLNTHTIRYETTSVTITSHNIGTMINALNQNSFNYPSSNPSTTSLNSYLNVTENTPDILSSIQQLTFTNTLTYINATQNIQTNLSIIAF